MKSILFGFAASALIAGLAAQTASAQPANAQNPAILIHADEGSVTLRGAVIPVGSSMGANPGDIVVVTGKATATYSNGCDVAIQGTYQIPANAPTCSKAVAATGDGKYVAAGLGAVALIGAAVGGGGGGSSDKPSSP
ncbi:MAG: hypothetical protein JWL98_2055 [Xanthomonadaceae bacterium]|nr:hypothetical protein [Xanthomonadaceae bacterium]